MKMLLSALSIPFCTTWILGCSAYTSAGRKDFEKAYSNAAGQIITSAKVQATSCHLQVAPTAIATQSLDPEKTYQIRHLSEEEIEICELKNVEETDQK